LVLSGGVPVGVKIVFFGGVLHAFSKHDGGIRPFAVGMTLRRLVAKAANSHTIGRCSAFLQPKQLGAGTKGGAEAIIHAACSFLDSAKPATP